jgi:hypothetical protein
MGHVESRVNRRGPPRKTTSRVLCPSSASSPSPTPTPQPPAHPLPSYYNYHVSRSHRAILDQLFQGLRRLEYRGYDSSGLCIDGLDAAALWQEPATPPAEANGNGAHANGNGAHANGNGAHANGNGAHANDNGTHANGNGCVTRCVWVGMGAAAAAARARERALNLQQRRVLPQLQAAARLHEPTSRRAQPTCPRNPLRAPRSPRALDDASRPIVIKAVGKISALEALVAEYVAEHGLDLEQQFTHHVGIAHTRWATHGRPTPVNSHPHVTAGEGGGIGGRGCWVCSSAAAVPAARVWGALSAAAPRWLGGLRQQGARPC